MEQQNEITSMDKLMAILCQTGGGYGVGCITFPLFILLVLKKDEKPFIHLHAKQALLSQLIISLYCFVFLVLTIIGHWSFLIPLLMGIIAFAGCNLWACIKASEGQEYVYPFLSAFK